jgi:hypothetical protein
MGVFFDLHSRLEGPEETVRAFLRYRIKQRKINPRCVPPEVIVEIIDSFVSSPDFEDQVERIAKLSQGMKNLNTPYLVIADEFKRRLYRIYLLAQLAYGLNCLDQKIKESINGG